MAPMKKKVEKEGGKKRDMIMVEVKKEIIEKHERGMRVADIARFYKKSTSTICTVLKKKEEIRGFDVAKGVTRVSKQRPRILEDVEKLLLVWINEKQPAGDTVTENLICKKAKALYDDLVSKLPDTSTENEEGFKASRGWFDNFKRRSGIHSVVRHGDTEKYTKEEELNSSVGEIQCKMEYIPEETDICDDPLTEEIMSEELVDKEETQTVIPGPSITNISFPLVSHQIEPTQKMKMFNTRNVERMNRKRKMNNTHHATYSLLKTMRNRQTKRDNCDVFGEFVAGKLRNLKTDHARNAVEHMISNLLYESSLGKYDYPNQYNPQISNLNSPRDEASSS